MALLSCTAQRWIRDSSSDLTRATGREKVTLLDLLAMLFQTQLRRLLAAFAMRAHGWHSREAMTRADFPGPSLKVPFPDVRSSGKAISPHFDR